MVTSKLLLLILVINSSPDKNIHIISSKLHELKLHMIAVNDLTRIIGVYKFQRRIVIVILVC